MQARATVIRRGRTTIVHEVRIVHPVAVDRGLVKLDGEGREIGRRRSPRHGDATDLFGELVKLLPPADSNVW